MRLLFPTAMAFAATASAPAQPAAQQESLRVGRTLVPGSDCATAGSHPTGQGSAWSSDPLMPKKLTDLPPADIYAAVYQLDAGGCMVPVMHRDVRTRR